MSKKVCFIGHRRVPSNITEKLQEAILQEIKGGCSNFTMGTHGEFDKLSLSCCKNIRKTYPNINIEVVITSLNAIKKIVTYDIFGAEIYTPYENVHTVMYEIEEKHFKRQIIESNRQMIDTCDTLICYVDENRTQSGAKTALTYAKRKGLKIINLKQNT